MRKYIYIYIYNLKRESMKQLLEAIRAKYLCLHDWEVVSKTEYTDCWKILLKCKKCGKLRKKRV